MRNGRGRRDGHSRIMPVTRYATAALVAAILVIASAACSPRTAAAGVGPDARGTSPDALMAAADAKACAEQDLFPPATAGQVMAGRLTVPHFPAVTIDPGRDGAVNWSMDPWHNPSWTADFISAEWVEPLISRYLAAALERPLTGPGPRPCCKAGCGRCHCLSATRAP